MAEPQFLTLADVADILAISASQARAMVRGQWRVEKARFEQWIEKRHQETAEAVRAGASLD